jgi:ubiquinone/menaquinone biosynthesis C-methylase UbiE
MSDDIQSAHTKETLLLKEGYEELHRKSAKSTADTKLRALLVRSIRKRAGPGILLDVACGAGEWVAYCESSKLFDYCCGVDISVTALRIAKTTSPASSFVNADAQYLPFRDSSFGVATCLGSLEHFPDPSAGAREISRVMDEHAISLVLVPNSYFLGHVYLVYRSGEPPDEGGQQFSESFATRKEWWRLFERNGLKVQDCLKYNHITKASKKVSQATRMLYNAAISPLLPANLSYAFIFECTKTNKKLPE